MEDVCVVKRLVAITLLALTLLLISCEESNNNNNNNNNPPPTVGEGSLEIIINNLPNGNIGQFLINVRGPNGYTKTIDRSTTLNALKPGRYEVVGFDFKLNSQDYYVDPPLQALDVAENQTSTATVAYTNTGSTSTKPQGFFTGFDDTDELVVDARVFAPLAPQQSGFESVNIASDEYKSNRFLLDLATNLNPALLSDIQVVADAFTFTDDPDLKSKCTRDVSISDQSAFANDVFFIVSRLTIDGSNGNEIQEEVAETILFEGAELQAIFWIYADRDVNISGNETCNNVSVYNQTNLIFNAELKTGWNLIAAQVSEANNRLSINLERVSGPRGDRWGVLRDDPPPIYGKDNGSTGGNPKGKLGGWPEANLGDGVITGTVFDIAGRPTRLTKLDVAKSVTSTGFFNLNLPNVPESLLRRLEFDDEDNCTGLINVVNEAFYQTVRLEIYVDGKRVGSAVAEDKDTDVEWWYLDRATTLTGEVTCNSGNNIEIIKADGTSLVQGWNMVLNKTDVSVNNDGSQTTYTTTLTAPTALPSTIGWRFDENQQDDSIPTEPLEEIGSPDAGSTSSNLRGGLGSWPSIDGAFKAIIKAPPDDPNDPPDDPDDPNALEDLVVGEDSLNSSGSFNFPLAGNVDAAYLEELDITNNWIDVNYPTNACSGDIMMDNATSQAQAVLGLYDGSDSRIGNADARVGSSDGSVSTIELSWIYVSTATKASGTRLCTNEDDPSLDDVFLVDLDLAAGWNILQSETRTLENGGSSRIWTSSASAPSQTFWIARVNDITPSSLIHRSSTDQDRPKRSIQTLLGL